MVREGTAGNGRIWLVEAGGEKGKEDVAGKLINGEEGEGA